MQHRIVYTILTVNPSHDVSEKLMFWGGCTSQTSLRMDSSAADDNCFLPKPVCKISKSGIGGGF